MAAFFTEWKDSKRMVYLHALITLSLVLLFMGIYINIPEESQRANIYQIMLLWAGIVAGIEAIQEKHWIFAWAGFGNQKRFISSFIAGGVIMFIAFSTRTLSIAAPLAVISLTSLQFIYTVVAAPYIEEKFFRGMALFTTIQVFKGNKIPYADIMGAIFDSFIFAVFHGFAFSWNMNGLIAAFVFGIFACVGNQYFKSTGFGFGAHLCNNALVYFRI